MTVLVTGGTGFLGAGLVRRLLADGARGRVLVRSPMKAKCLSAQAAKIVVGDITNRAAVTAGLDDVAVVYHLGGRLLLPGVPGTEYYNTHAAGAKLLLACCQGVPHLARFVHCIRTGRPRRDRR